MKHLLSVPALALICFMFPETNKADSTIYVFDNYAYQQLDYLTLNGDTIPLVERPVEKEGLMTKYKKGLTKYIIKNDGRLTLTREFHWAGKPYYDEITLDLNDGDVYYLELVTGWHSTIKVLKPKEGEKKIEKAEKKPKEWVIFPEVVYEN